MRIALYIEDGCEQLVLTPEGDTEKAILAKLTSDSRVVSIKRGSFYSCRGGWIRKGQDDDSTILVMTAPQAADEASSS